MHKKTRRRGIGLLAAGVVLLATTLAGCGGKDSSSADGVTVDDSGKLSKLTPVTITLPAKLESFSAVIMDDEWGEFKKRNIKLNIKIAKSSDALVLLAKGEVDGVLSGISANILNAVKQGAELRLVMPGELAVPNSKTGWWASKKALNGKTFEPSMLKGKTLASSQGANGSSILGIYDLLKGAGLSMSDITVKTLPSTDIITALENGAVFGGVVTQPLNAALEKNDSAVQIAEQARPDFASTTMIFGPSLLKDKPQVGKAFISAMLATYREHLQGDYVNDPARGQALAKALDVTWDRLKLAPSGIWPTTPSYPDNYIEVYEEIWRQVPDTLTYQGNIDPKSIIDTSYLEWALGKS